MEGTEMLCPKCQFENREGTKFNKERGKNWNQTALIFEMPIQREQNFGMNIGNHY